MAFIPAVDTARVAVNQTMHGQQVTNVLHFTKAGGFATQDLLDLANAVIVAWNTRVAPFQSTDIQYNSVVARDMSAQDAEAVEVQFPALSGGDVAFPALPGNVAATVSWRTGFAGRSRRGRSYMAGLAENSVVGNEITGGTQDTIPQNMNALIADLLVAGFQLVIASYYSGVDVNGVPIPRLTALLTPVLTAVVDQWVDSQRRRLQGRGN